MHPRLLNLKIVFGRHPTTRHAQLDQITRTLNLPDPPALAQFSKKALAILSRTLVVVLTLLYAVDALAGTAILGTLFASLNHGVIVAVFWGLYAMRVCPTSWMVLACWQLSKYRPADPLAYRRLACPGQHYWDPIDRPTHDTVRLWIDHETMTLQD